MSVFRNVRVRSRDSFASERRLVVSLAQEARVDDRRKQRVLEGDRPEDDAYEDNEFDVGDNSHSGVIVG